MSTHSAIVSWERGGAVFTDNHYSRVHTWSFDGGLTVAASASPSVIPPPLSDPRNVDPEEAFVASLSSCHMLWFLSIAAARGLVVERYTDHAAGRLEKNEYGRLAFTRVVLRPVIEFGGTRQPAATEVREIHDEAHRNCFIANSVRTEVIVE